jgi:DNA-binding response OmpR family regulator
MDTLEQARALLADFDRRVQRSKDRCECPYCGAPQPGWGDIAFDPRNGRVTRNGKTARIGGKQMAIFRLLWAGRGKTASVASLFDAMYPNDPADYTRSNLTVQVHNLRGNLAPLGLYIHSYFGLGYALALTERKENE